MTLPLPPTNRGYELDGNGNAYYCDQWRFPHAPQIVEICNRAKVGATVGQGQPGGKV